MDKALVLSNWKVNIAENPIAVMGLLIRLGSLSQHWKIVDEKVWMKPTNIDKYINLQKLRFQKLFK